MLTGPSACMRHGFVCWCLTVIPSVTVATAALPLTASSGVAQSLVVSPRASLMGGDETAASAGLRAEVGLPVLALFGHFGGFSVRPPNCDGVFPPSCTTSSGGIEILGGVRLSLPQIGPAHPAISLGAGALFWDDDPQFENGTGSVWEAELRVGVRVSSWADLLLGGVVKSVGQSVSGETTLARDRGTYGGVVVGLLIPLINEQ